MDETMMVAGIGCKRGAPTADVETAIRAALARVGVAAQELDAIATIAAKQGEAGIAAAAANLGVALLVVSDADLHAAGDRVETRSERVLALTGVPSVAEAAALAAAGPTARLICSRLIAGAATCALAASGISP